MNILALDLATRTGWALIEHGRRESGVQVFDVKRGESPGMRYLRFRRWLEEIGPRADLIVYEQTVRSPGRMAIEIADGFATRVQEYCAAQGEAGRVVDHQGVYPATLKKWTTGKGNAKKPDMLAAAFQLGFVSHAAATWDDNEIDAICLREHALAEIVPTTAASERRAR